MFTIKKEFSPTFIRSLNIFMSNGRIIKKRTLPFIANGESHSGRVIGGQVQVVHIDDYVFNASGRTHSKSDICASFGQKNIKEFDFLNLKTPISKSS